MGRFRSARDWRKGISSSCAPARSCATAIRCGPFRRAKRRPSNEFALTPKGVIAITRIAPTALVLLLMMPMAARAQVALVEDVNSKSAGVQSMDYVATGKQIRLGKQDTLVLSYLKSCWREAIVGLHGGARRPRARSLRPLEYSRPR